MQSHHRKAGWQVSEQMKVSRSVWCSFPSDTVPPLTSCPAQAVPRCGITCYAFSQHKSKEIWKLTAVLAEPALGTQPWPVFSQQCLLLFLFLALGQAVVVTHSSNSSSTTVSNLHESGGGPGSLSSPHLPAGTHPDECDRYSQSL